NVPTVMVKYFNSSSWSSVNIHYNGGNGWTTSPGIAMSNEGNGWWGRTIDVVSNQYEFVFNNNAGTWDNNLNRDYISRVSLGNTIYVSNRVVGIGPLYSGSAPVNVTIRYYRPDWSVVNIHYYNGSNWTTSPGIRMTNEGNGWWIFTIRVVNGNNYQFVFNNNSGTWDNNNGQNYRSLITFTNVVVGGY
ncbi:MAG: carbohydrate binding domain-containing protein, partial [Brevinematia bacterium]